MKRFLLTLVLIVLVLLLITPLSALAQDVSIQPVAQDAPAQFDLQVALAQVIAFLTYALTLAGAIQLAINQIKPLFLDPVKNRKSAPTDGSPDNVYLAWMYLFRTVLTSISYVYLWGGVAATRAVMSILPGFVPDVGVGAVTVAIVVLGEEVIHPLLDRAYVLRDVAKLLASPPQTPPLTSAAIVPEALG